MTPTDPLLVLEYLAIGLIVGAAGQLIRVIVGLKKAFDQSDGQQSKDVVDIHRLAISLLISMVIGAIAGMLGVLGQVGTPLTTSSLVTLLAVGYAGTDFIEGFMQKQNSPNATAVGESRLSKLGQVTQ